VREEGEGDVWGVGDSRHPIDTLALQRPAHQRGSLGDTERAERFVVRGARRGVEPIELGRPPRERRSRAAATCRSRD
jgi:hypothetical protein